jgi:uncharacterized protein involved in high-affinity Fe2+ transport
MGEKAVIVIKRKRTESLNGYLLVVCKAPSWKALEKDSDLGPFLKYKKAARNLDAIVAMPSNPKDGSTYGIYFQDNRPIGFVEIKTGQGEQLTQDNLAKAYVSVMEASDHGTAGQIRFEIGQVYSDDNQPIPTLTVINDGQASPANQQEDYRSGAIKISSGYLLVWNVPNNYYILEIKGKDVRQTSTDRKFFSVDGMFLQIVDVSLENVLQAAKRQDLDDKAILEAHRDWEAKFMEGEYKAKLKIESSWQKVPNGNDALLWQASVPESAKGNVKKQVYLTVVKGDYVLMLGGAVTDTSGEGAIEQLLLKTIETLKTSDKPTDLQKLRDTIGKESSGSGVNYE